jgi:pyrroloquinoline-quinone synthase
MSAFSLGKGVTLNSAEELEAALRQIGATRYHNLHPFHRLLHGGKLNKGQVQAWALNRYYYQSTIPIKDAVVISRFRDRGIRLEWRHRIEDHDGDLGTEGGIERWLKLTEGLGWTALTWNPPKASFPRRALRSTPMCTSSATRHRSRPSPPR